MRSSNSRFLGIGGGNFGGSDVETVSSLLLPISHSFHLPNRLYSCRIALRLDHPHVLTPLPTPNPQLSSSAFESHLAINAQGLSSCLAYFLRHRD